LVKYVIYFAFISFASIFMLLNFIIDFFQLGKLIIGDSDKFAKIFIQLQ
jgi:hypothetical protein